MAGSPRTKSGRRRAVIIGGSMSGLFTAAFLRKVGWDVDVYERSPVELVGRGAGITTHPELLDALEASGAGTRDLGVTVERRITLDRDGRVIGERHLPQILTSWDRLQRLLRETIDPAHYHLGRTFVRVEQDGRRVRVRFAEGGEEEADLLVGGDGIHSGVRAQVAPDVRPIYSGYFSWRGTANEADLAPETLESIFPYFTFFLPGERHQIIGYAIAGFDNDLRPGRRRYNFIWHRVGEPNELRKMCIDENGRQHDFSVPPHLVRKSLVGDMRAEAASMMPAAFLDVLAKIKQPFFTPINDFSSPSLVYGRVALVGDAASTSRPHMGFGVSKAGGDAQALAEALREHGGDVDAALDEYNAVRQPIGERIMLHGRKLGAHFGVNLKTDEDRYWWNLLQSHEEVMDRIGTPNFLE
ncbi:MAG TPA: FAD binding domain-containing protein [Xanthobacteraceae bacterium]|nr:FAD binding domain-containing protein [Xanthobacteraceae bacterium]